MYTQIHAILIEKKMLALGPQINKTPAWYIVAFHRRQVKTIHEKYTFASIIAVLIPSGMIQSSYYTT
jgi:hypothetical protein